MSFSKFIQFFAWSLVLLSASTDNVKAVSVNASATASYPSLFTATISSVVNSTVTMSAAVNNTAHAGDRIYHAGASNTWVLMGTISSIGTGGNTNVITLTATSLATPGTGTAYMLIPSNSSATKTISVDVGCTLTIDVNVADSMVANFQLGSNSGGSGTNAVININAANLHVIPLGVTAGSKLTSGGSITLTAGFLRWRSGVTSAPPTNVSYTYSGGTVVFYPFGGSGSINLNGTSFSSLRIEGSSLTNYTAVSAITVSGVLTIANGGIFSLGSNVLTMGTSSTLSNSGIISTTAITNWVTDNRTSGQYTYGGTVSFNGASTTIPSTNRQFTNLTINAATALSDSIRVIGTLTIANGVKLNLSNKKLTVNLFASTGQITGSNTAEILYTGTTNSTIYMDQTTSGTTNTLKSLTMYGPASLLTLGNKLVLVGGTNSSNGELILGTTSSSVLTSNTSFGTGASPVSPNLEMRVNNSGTHAVMHLRGGLIVGEVLLEDLLEAGYKSYRQVGFAIDSANGVSMNQLTDDMDIYALVASGSYTNKGTSQNPNGYLQADGTTTKNSAYLYQETASPRWVPYQFISSQTDFIPKGRGLMVFLRPLGTTTAGSYAEQKYEVEGSVNCASDVTVTTFLDANLTGGSKTNGWNLIANPYHSYLDYSVFVTDNASNLQGGASQAVKKYDKSLKNYIDALTTSGGGTWRNSQSNVVTPNLDPGDAFFIQAKTNSSSLTFKRSQTTPNRSVSIDRTNKLEIDSTSFTAMNVKLFSKADTTIGDVMNMWFADWGKDISYGPFDVPNLSGNCLDISVSTSDGKICSKKIVSNQTNCTVPLSFTSCANGEYFLLFDQIMNNSIEGEIIKLIDRYKGTENVVNLTDKYTFTTDDNPSSKASDRFYLTYSSKSLNTSSFDENQVIVLPNPVKNGAKVQVIMMDCDLLSYRLVNTSGQILLDAEHKKFSRAVEIEMLGMQNQVCFLQLETTKGTLAKKIIINN